MVKHKACLFLVVILSTRGFTARWFPIHTVVCSGSGSVSWYFQFGSFVHPIQ
jgi:hypothetical protein